MSQGTFDDGSRRKPDAPASPPREEEQVHPGWAAQPQASYDQVSSGGWGAPGHSETGPLKISRPGDKKAEGDGGSSAPAPASGDAPASGPQQATQQDPQQPSQPTAESASQPGQPVSQQGQSGQSGQPDSQQAGQAPQPPAQGEAQQAAQAPTPPAAPHQQMPAPEPSMYAGQGAPMGAPGYPPPAAYGAMNAPQPPYEGQMHYGPPAGMQQWPVPSPPPPPQSGIGAITDFTFVGKATRALAPVLFWLVTAWTILNVITEMVRFSNVPLQGMNGALFLTFVTSVLFSVVVIVLTRLFLELCVNLADIAERLQRSK